MNIDNVGAIRGSTVQTGLQTAFHEQLRKQASTTGMPPSGDDFNLDSDVYVDDPVEINLGDTGGKLYYRILFYNYEDVIEFHDDLLQKFYGKIAFDQYIRIYDASTGDLIGTSKSGTVSIWTIITNIMEITGCTAWMSFRTALSACTIPSM